MIGLRYWHGVLSTWERIVDGWLIEMGEEVEPVLTGAVDSSVSTDEPTGMVRGPAPDIPADIPGSMPPHERQPAGLRAARVIKGTLTRTTRHDLGRAMLDMSAPGGWRSSTLNPDMADAHKFAILSDRFDKITVTDDPHVLYGELLALAAVAAGWAQGIERRRWRDAKRAQRAASRARHRARRAARGGPATHGDVD